jgi:hypothetical protein
MHKDMYRTARIANTWDVEKGIAFHCVSSSRDTDAAHREATFLHVDETVILFQLL